MNAEKIRSAKIEQINNAPALVVDGKPIPMMTYQWRLGCKIDENPSHDSEWMIKNMIKAGVEIFFTGFTISDPLKFEEYFDVFMQEMELLTKEKSDALVMPWITIKPYEGFCDKYPGDVICFEDGSHDKWNSARLTGLPRAESPRYSFASEAWKHEVAGTLRQFIRRLLNGPYAKNIVGYFFFIYDQEFSWFFEFDGRKHAIDFSPAMHFAFRNYLIEKYRGDERLLREAWKDETVTFETVCIPQVLHRIDGDFGYFRDPSQKMQVLDYVACHNAVCAEKLLYLGKVCKEETAGKHVVGSFWGYLQNQDIQLGGQTEMKAVMDSPYVDFWAAPFTYENRNAGNFASMRMATRSLNKHGKMYFVEVDTFISDTPQRTLIAHDYPDQTLEEDRALLKRDFIYPFIEGCQGWWIDWCAGASQYEEELRPLLQKIHHISKDGFNYPRGPISDIAGIIDQESLHIPACNSMNHDDAKTWTSPILLMRHSLQQFRIHELPRIGTSVDFYETDDVLTDTTRKYRMYIFLNQYSADERERELIEKQLKKDGNLLVWMYGSGLISPDEKETLSLKNASELTGFEFGCEMRETRCAMKALNTTILPDVKKGEKLGDFHRRLVSRQRENGNGCSLGPMYVDEKPEYHDPNLVNPLIYVEDKDAIPLAVFEDNGKVGMAIKKFDDWTSVYIGAPCIQAKVLRGLAKVAGAHLYVDKEEIVFANESYVGIHTSEDGPVNVQLRNASDVMEVFEDRIIGTEINEFTDTVPKNSTRLYRVISKETEF